MTDLGNGLFAIKAYSKLKMDGLFKINRQNFFEYAAVFLDAGIRLDFNDFDFKYSFEILGTVTNDNIDFDVHELVHVSKSGLCKDYTCNYIVSGEEFKLMSVEDSFRSLLSSKGLYFENPYGKEKPEKGLDKFLEWETAEQNLIEKLVIIKKV